MLTRTRFSEFPPAFSHLLSPCSLIERNQGEKIMYINLDIRRILLIKIFLDVSP